MKIIFFLEEENLFPRYHLFYVMDIQSYLFCYIRIGSRL